MENVAPAVPPNPRKIHRVEGLTDVVDLLDRIVDDVDSGFITDTKAKIKLQASKQYIQIAQTVIRQRYLERGHKPEKDLRLRPAVEPSPKCSDCGTDVAGLSFCGKCGKKVS